MNTLYGFGIALLMLLSGQSLPLGGIPISSGGGSVCTSPPTMTSRWPVYGTGAGAGSSLTDVVGGNTATQATSINQPTYTASAVNGLAALTFVSSPNFQFLVLNTPISVLTTSFTYYAVFNLTASGSNNALLSGTTSSVEWRINSSGHQEVLSSGVASLGTGTMTFSPGTWYGVAFTFNTVTGGTLFVCSGGTCSSDGSISASTFAQPVSNFGDAPAAGDPFNGLIAEWGLATSVVSLTTTGTYIKSCYNV
jgi:hypothetical protein